MDNYPQDISRLAANNKILEEYQGLCFLLTKTIRKMVKFKLPKDCEFTLFRLERKAKKGTLMKFTLIHLLVKKNN